MKKALKGLFLGALALLAVSQTSPAFWHGVANALTNWGLGGNTCYSSPDGVVNVKNCGVVGNGQMYFDGAMAISSSTLSTKQPLASASESGTTVTLTFANGSGFGGLPGGDTAPPLYGNWVVGGTITVAGVSVSGYNGTFTITAIPSSNTIQYTTTSGLSNASGGTAYTNSPFTAGDVGKLICVQYAASGYGQACGTISTYTDAQDVVLSFANASGTYNAPLEFVYGTSDQSAVAAIFSNTNLPNGGEVYFPTGIYILTAEIDVPLTGSWNIVGTASGEVGTRYENYFIAVGRPNTALDWLNISTSCNCAAFYFGKGISQGTGTFQTQHDAIRDIALVGGVGYQHDGGGSSSGMYGLILSGTNQFEMHNAFVMNFNNDCINVNTFWQGVLIQNSSIFNCAGWGINTVLAQAYNYIGNYIQDNGNGVSMTQPASNNNAGGTILGNTIQGSAGVDVRLSCGLVAGNYFDTGDTVFSMSDSGSYAACTTFTGNMSKATIPQIVFSVAGTPLPACNATWLAHQPPVAVSDATACTAGTTYTGSGSTKCAVQCDGTNWKETGAGAY